MEDVLTCRQIKPGDIREAVALVLRVFDRYVAPLFAPEGVAEFYKHANPEAMAERLQSGNLISAAFSDGRLVGLVEIREFSHVSLLFVDENHQHQGVARRLLDYGLKICRDRNPDLTGLTVNSSPNSVQTYLKLGFNALGPEETKNGIRFTPMKMVLPESGD